MKGVSAATFSAYCVSQVDDVQTLWLKSLTRATSIPLKAGALRPSGAHKLPLPQFRPSSEVLKSRGEAPSVAQPASRCAPWEPLPERGSLSWSVGEETLKVSRWGWMSEREGRASPRALSHMSLDPQRGAMLLAGRNGLWWWPLKSRSAPVALLLPAAISHPISGLTRDGGGVWVRGREGQAVAVQVTGQGRPKLTLASGPITLPAPSPNISVPLGGALFSVTRGGVQLSWGAQRTLSPPTYDLALIDPQHVAVATSVGVSIYQASVTNPKPERIRLIAELKLGAPVTALTLYQGALYLLSPSLGLLWADVTAPLAQAP